DDRYSLLPPFIRFEFIFENSLQHSRIEASPADIGIPAGRAASAQAPRRARRRDVGPRGPITSRRSATASASPWRGIDRPAPDQQTVDVHSPQFVHTVVPSGLRFQAMHSRLTNTVASVRGSDVAPLVSASALRDATNI